MAKKAQPHLPPHGPSLPPERALQLLRGQRDKGKQILNNRPITSAVEQSWETVTRDVLSRAFGADSPNVSSVMDVGKFAFAFGGGDERQWEAQRAKDMDTRLQIIGGLIELIEAEVAVTSRARLTSDTRTDDTLPVKRVFLVHGHDDALTQETARFLERLSLEVTILREEQVERL